MGPEAYRFVGFLISAKQKIWQALPLNPVTVGDSPYSSPSAFAGDFLLISPEKMVEDGWLQAPDIESTPSFPAERVEYGEAGKLKHRYLKAAFERADNLNDSYENFCCENSFWLEDYSFFMELKEFYGGAAWVDWPPTIKRVTKTRQLS